MKIFKHLGIVLKHKYYVFINACKLGIPFRGLVHDMSKFSFEEFSLSCKFFLGDKSPTIEERKYRNGFSNICVHHTGRNKHHWQYWLDYDRKSLIINRIPYKYSLEYVCDVAAASKAYHPKEFTLATVYNYFSEHSKHYLMHPATKEFILWCIDFSDKNKGFRSLKKKITKAKYLEISSKYPNTIIIPLGDDFYEKLNTK